MQSMRKAVSHFPRLENFLASTLRLFLRKPPAYVHTITKELVAECVKQSSPTILDIGSNDGGHTLWFVEIFDTPQVYSFEPDPRAIARFKENLGNHPCVQLFEMALSDRDGEISFYQSTGQSPEQLGAEMLADGWDYSGSIRRPKKHLELLPWVKFENQISVETATLDGWAEKHGVETVDFIWMDVQGAEKDVFKGGKRILANTRFLYTEYSNQEMFEGQASLPELLKQLGDFEILVKYSTDVLLRNTRFEFQPGQKLQHMLKVIAQNQDY